MSDIKNLLVCPNCYSKLSWKSDEVKCSKCLIEYKIVNEKPCFVKKIHEGEEFSKETMGEKFHKSGKMIKAITLFRKYLSPPDTSFESEIKIRGVWTEKNLARVLASSADKRILNIGSSSAKTYKNIINLDIGPYSGVDVVADGKKLPFKENSFDIVLIEMVLEHVDEPEKVISEASRVLKRGGKLYISIPFVFAFHGSPNDFNRMTLEGLKRRIENNGLRVKESGVLSGPSSTLSQVLRYYFAMLLSFNNDVLFSFMLNIFGWLTFPIKYLDFIVSKHKKAHMIAATIYAVGEKR